MATQLTNILTEAGTNELEVLVFLLDEGYYGVNVAKVREIVTMPTLTTLPYSHEAVRGVFKLRDHVHPLIDLRKYFGMPRADAEENARVIVMEFNKDRMGFLVDHIDRIHRVSWKDMSEVPWTGAEGDTAMTSVLKINNQMILMLDFERISFKIAGIDQLADAAPTTLGVQRQDARVLLADDSATMRRMLTNSLQNAGFTKINLAHDGEEAWNSLRAAADTGELPDIIVTDIEMPRMDGLCLTKNIKEHPQLKHVPVIVFSSLVSDDNLKKCKAVGADRQLTKPELPGLVTVMDEVLSSAVRA
ncbi:MAG: chemotaxis protein CheV [Phycisphaerae bacterium]|nr:chemotaxis protein CheV [Phycisphaerae bacterium]